MQIRGRSFIAAFMAGAIFLYFSVPAYPSGNSDAARKYAIAGKRLADLKKTSKKMKYRSYWIDCIRTFEMVEKKYPKSPSAGDACFDRAGVYQDLYLYNRYWKDLNESIRLYGSCQANYPEHAQAPEALYHIIELAKEFKKDHSLVSATLAKLAELYPQSPWTEKAKSRFQPGRTALKKKQEQEIRKMPVPALLPDTPAGVVKSVRYWSGGAYTRIVIDQDKPVTFQTLELKDRLVFDLLNARIGDSVERDPLPVNDGILKQVRTSQFAPTVVRVVLDLASIKSYAAFPLHDPDRLVIDVTGEGGKAQHGPVASSESGTVQGGRNIEPHTEQPGAVIPAAKVPGRDNNGERLSLSSQLGLKIKTIAIDAGHGGHDPGAIGRSGLREKMVTLDIAKRLAVLVKDRLGCNVVMTRDKDTFIPLEQRPFIAKSKNADLFVSIHVNANRKRSTRGIETYIQGLNASDRDAMATAARENATTTKKLSQLDSELEKILKGLSMQSDDIDSVELANAIQGSLVNTMKPVQRHVVNLGVKRAFFYVLINTEMPSILAEVGFISNPEEEQMLKKESYRQKIAEALFQGVKKYVDMRSPQVAGI
jgi:N-acetylmuramoyl-L-alanine amidase